MRTLKDRLNWDLWFHEKQVEYHSNKAAGIREDIRYLESLEEQATT